jgi:hypothetical protein
MILSTSFGEMVDLYGTYLSKGRSENGAGN